MTILQYNTVFFRHSMKDAPFKRNCQHSRGGFECSQITSDDVTSFANGFYSTTSKLLQDGYLLKYCLGFPPKRIDRRNGGSGQSIRIDYHIRKESGKVVKVCKKAFFSILKISESRVNRVCKYHFETGNVPKENRGGDRKSIKFMDKTSSIIDFIQSFHLIDLHYCRSKIKYRQYLPSELNIKKMAQICNDQMTVNLRVKSSYFRKIFNTRFNIGFKSPATDLCSTCIMLDEQIKHCKSEKSKRRLVARKKYHRLRAKAFFMLLKKGRPRSKSFSFDCQKNQLLPKVADQAAYRSRQLYQNNMGIVEGTSESKLTKENVFLYEWTENNRPKGSNEIASALYHRLNNTNFTGYTKAILFADGCGGQNKNSIVVGMCAYWLQQKSPKQIQELELIFPVVGHSYMPPDRVFAFIEKEIRNKQSIISPKEYVDIFDNFGTVIKLGGLDCPVYDWKTETKTHLKAPSQLHFKFNPCKRFILKKEGANNIVLRGENFYKKDVGTFQEFCKRGKSISSMDPSILESGVPIASAKLQDVNNLLEKHFGKLWRNMDLESLTFYKNLLPNIMEEEVEAEEDINSEAETDESSAESEYDEEWI